MGATVFAQTPATDQSTPPAATQSAPSASINPNDSTTYATGKPLENQSREGFWGQMNPFARKKWVAARSRSDSGPDQRAGPVAGEECQ